MKDILVLIFLFFGLFFMLVASVGILRMPDLFLRTSATTKAATLGVACLIIAVALHFNQLSVTSRAVAIVVFVLLTTPVAAHMIGRSAYFDGVALWSKTGIDELRGRYDLKTHRLSTAEEATTNDKKAP